MASDTAAGTVWIASSLSVSDMPMPDSSSATRGRVSAASKRAA
jgi:hypothetical protein